MQKAHCSKQRAVSFCLGEIVELLKNDIIELTIESQGAFAEGVAHTDEGVTVFVKGALTGERVRAKVIGVKPKYCFAILEKLLTKSPYRVQPPCPLFGKCGGCDLMHLNYVQQLEHKKNIVKQTLEHVGNLTNIEVNDVVPSKDVLRYRNKLSLPVRLGKDGTTEIGLFAKNSHRIISTTDCLLQYEWNVKLIESVKDLMQRKKFTPYDENSGKGDIRHIVAREVGGHTAVTIVATKFLDIQSLDLNFLDRHSLYLNINQRRDNVILGDEWKKIKGTSDEIEEDGLRFSIHPSAFFQVNDEVRKELYSSVVKNRECSSAIEAYSGAGLLSAYLAQKSQEVFGIEINAQAHASAQNLAKQNNLSNMYPILGDVTKKIEQVIKACQCEPFIVLDPPRSGLNEEVIKALCQAKAKEIVYISCNPATLARDLSHFVRNDYEIKSVTPFDMFPQTTNVETLVVLSHKKPH